MLAFYLALIDDKQDQGKFEGLYNKYKNLMFTVAQDILKNEASSEDALQETFIKIAKIVNKIEDVDSHRTKNLTVIITRNTCFDMLDKEKRHRGLISFEDVKDTEAYDNFDLKSIEKKEIVKAIHKLSDEDSDIIMLKYYYNFNEKEIAHLIGVSYDATRKRLQRARVKLAQLLEEWR